MLHAALLLLMLEARIRRALKGEGVAADERTSPFNAFRMSDLMRANT
jgi:hypothetical protein